MADEKKISAMMDETIEALFIGCKSLGHVRNSLLY
jgi:hypothetical protein